MAIFPDPPKLDLPKLTDKVIEIPLIVPKYVPDPKMHLIVSLVKSGIRIIGYLLLLGIHSPWATIASIVLIASEVVGIGEELV